jgi:hyperosmotically inducible periplasmic protein
MDSNEETVHKHIVVDVPGQRHEVLTERTVRGPEESRLSTGTIVIIALLAVVAVGSILYLVSNRNANESANRNANRDLASQASRDQAAAAAPAPVIIQQPAAPQAPVIIQQPVAVPAEQPAQPNPRDSASDDANMQEVATKRLSEELAMGSVSVNISDARAVLSGTVSSSDTKAKAEQVVKAVRGVKSVDNKIVVL